MADAPYVWLAKLIRPQGRRGELLAEILTDFPERFAERRRVFLLPADSPDHPDVSALRSLEVESHWLHKNRLVLKFSGIDSINDAEALRGMVVAVPATERAPLAEDAVYIGDLIGCRVIDETPAVPVDLGEVVDVQREPVTADLLVVRTPAGQELLVPFARAYLVGVDVTAKRVRMRLPGGLAEINAPLTTEERAAQPQEAAAQTAFQEPE